ncbi:7354_t:CDS:2, partial [Acaulospora colombiana]
MPLANKSKSALRSTSTPVSIRRAIPWGIIRSFNAPIMKYLPAQILLLLSSSLFSSVRAAQLNRTGETTIYGYRGTIYTAHDYRPICGTLSPDQFQEELSVHDACTAPIRAFSSTADTFALYTSTGTRQSDTSPIARGTAYCMCYALGTVSGDKQANFCILVDKDGKTTDVNSNTLSVAYGRGFAEGNFQSGEKALPQCFEIDVAAVTASIDAAGTETHVQVAGPSTTENTGSSPTGSSGSNSPSSSSSTNVQQVYSSGSPSSSPSSQSSVGSSTNTRTTRSTSKSPG